MIKRIREINNILLNASKAYYSGNTETISNFEYDRLYDELLELEKSTGIVLSNSVTQCVGYDAVSGLAKVTHPEKMLSLNKTKDVDEFLNWLGNNFGCLSWKLDGLTCVLTYTDGKLVQAVTRGNGEVGEDITFNAVHFNGVPYHIPIKDTIIVRGEVLMHYSDFNKINNEMDMDSQYKNPRNLCAGTVRQLDSQIFKERTVNFYAFNYIQGSKNKSFSKRLDELYSLGFQVVDHYLVNKSNLIKVMNFMKYNIDNVDFPSDGLVLMYDDCNLIRELGDTAKYPKGGLAFKWTDDTVETTLRDVEWSVSRTGSINPVAIFDTVEIDGTDVSRASLHNLSIVKGLKLGIGDVITVYKANMIIPQVSDNLTCSDTLEIPIRCPVCNHLTEIVSSNSAQILMCKNSKCEKKIVSKFSYFVSRDCMNISGLSEAAIAKFVKEGFVSEFADIYKLERYKKEIIKLNGFGKTSYKSIIDSVNKSRTVKAETIVCSLGINGVGKTVSALLLKKYKSLDKLTSASANSLKSINGIGETVAHEIYSYFHTGQTRREFNHLIEELNIIVPEIKENIYITGKKFAITGSIAYWKNRNELKSYIESLGGIVSDSVTIRTDYLINNDTTSDSYKNTKAKKFGVKIITEDEFKELLQ